MVNPVLSVPYFDVVPRATRVPGLECGGRSQTATDALGSKPLPSMLTIPPGATRPGLTRMTGPPSADTAWPPSVTVGVGVARDDGTNVGVGVAELWLETFAALALPPL